MQIMDLTIPGMDLTGPGIDPRIPGMEPIIPGMDPEIPEKDPTIPGIDPKESWERPDRMYGPEVLTCVVRLDGFRLDISGPFR